VWSGGDGAGATWKQARWMGDLVLPAMMAAVGALQRGRGAVVVCMEAGTRAGGARVSGGVNDPNVCGLCSKNLCLSV
jgi:hypothetical protein